jgi:Protein of unknown function (DUF3606)
MNHPDATAVPEDRIAIDDPADCADWEKKLDVTAAQLAEAVAAVGTLASDVELHLKGTRSITNADRVDEADAADGTNMAS